MPDTNRNGIVVLSPVWNQWPGKSGVRNLGKNRQRQPRLTQKRTLKMKLKCGQWTFAVRKDGPQMLHGLQQRIGVRARWRRLFPAEPCPHQVQTPLQATPQPIQRFQDERQPQFFSSGFDGKPRQHFRQPPPHQRSRQRVTRQNVSHDKKKSSPATAALPTVGTKHPLTSESFSTSGVGIIAQSTAVPIQTASAAAMRTRRLLEGKSQVFNS
jgi:hypothetical protein